MRDNPVKQRLRAGGTVFGTMVFEFLSPGLPQMAANAGADYLLYDMEHSGLGIAEIKLQCALCRGLGIVPLVRPPSKSYADISKLLDVGAMGLVFQMVESAEEAAELVSFTRYPPVGVRGAMFGAAHDDYRAPYATETIEAANDRLLLLALVETPRGLDNVEKIAAVDGIDAVHLGQGDLSVGLGIPGQMDDPRIQAAIDRVAAAAAAAGKPAAAGGGSADWGRMLLDRGYRMISHASDIALFQGGLAEGLAALRSR